MDLTIRTSAFFDREAVLRVVGEHGRQALSKYGAYTRRAAKSSLRYSKNTVSRPGQPPKVHRGSLGNRSALRELIYFSLDAAAKSVVIGPEALGSNPVVPALLEDGGATARRVNPRRTMRRVGGSGEILLGRHNSATTKRNKDGHWVTYAKLRTQQQAARANRLNAELYGPATIEAGRVEPRPFMVPAAAKANAALPNLWKA